MGFIKAYNNNKKKKGYGHRHCLSLHIAFVSVFKHYEAFLSVTDVDIPMFFSRPSFDTHYSMHAHTYIHTHM